VLMIERLKAVFGDVNERRNNFTYKVLHALRLFARANGVDVDDVLGLLGRGDAWDRFLSYLRERGYTGMTVNNIISKLRAVCDLYSVRVDWNRVNKLKRMLWRGELSRNPFAENEGELDREKIRRMLFYGCSSLRDKVMILVMATSGISIGDLLALRLRDIEDLYSDRDCYKLEFRRRKTNVKTITFITREARDILLQYLEERKRKGENIDPNSLVVTLRDGRPLRDTQARSIFYRIFEKAGLQENIGKDARGHNRKKYHPHLLRKFFRTALRNAGIERIYVEAMIGHNLRSTFGVEMVYDKQADRPEVLEEQYRKAIPQLTFLSELPYLEQKKCEAELEERVRRLEKILKKLLALQTQHSLQDLEAV